MSGNDALMKALADVSERRAALEVEYERIGAELAKLRLAENALRAIIEDTPIEDSACRCRPPVRPRAGPGRAARGRPARAARPAGELDQGPPQGADRRSGPQGLSQPQILRALPDAAPATINAYLSGMVTAGEALQVGNFYTRSATGTRWVETSDEATTPTTARSRATPTATIWRTRPSRPARPDRRVRPRTGRSSKTAHIRATPGRFLAASPRGATT